MTATQVQFRRGTAAQIAAFSGAQGELVVDTTNNRVVVQDGATAGGFPAAKLSEITAVNGVQGTVSIVAGDGGLVTTTGSTIALAEPGGPVNQFRNARMDVAQRGTSGSVASGATAYTLDGWQINAIGAAAAWSQQYSANLAGNALRINCASGLTACLLQQRIESAVAAALLTAGKTAQNITVQFAIFNNTGAAITCKLATFYAATQDNFGSVTGDLAATNLQTISNGAVGILALTFTPSGNLANGYQVQLQFSGALNAASGSIDISRADIRATPSVATGLNGNPPPPELRPAWLELLACIRFYRAFGGLLGVAAGANWTPHLSFVPPMFAAPNPSSGVILPSSLSLSDDVANNYTVTGLSYGAANSSFSVNGGRVANITGTGLSGVTNGASLGMLGPSGNIAVTCEL